MKHKMPLLLIACLFLPAALANAPAPPSYFYCEIVNCPKEAAYLDLLIRLDPADPRHTSFNKTNARGGITESSPIVTRSEDGYVSLSFRFTDVTAEGQMPTPLFVLKDPYQSLDKISPDLKAVLLDRDGNILQISEPVSLRSAESLKYADGLRYDAAANTAEVRFGDYWTRQQQARSRLSRGGALLLTLLISVAAETLLAGLFRLPWRRVALVNLATQGLMHAVFWAAGGFPYPVLLILAECGVFAAETAAYLWLFKDVSKGKIAFYAFCANALTWALGAGLNALNLFA